MHNNAPSNYYYFFCLTFFNSPYIEKNWKIGCLKNLSSIVKFLFIDAIIFVKVHLILNSSSNNINLKRG